MEGKKLSEPKYKNLFKPIILGNQFFKNRLFASPQDNPDLTYHHFLTDDARAFYEAKAIGGFASVCIGDFMVESGKGYSHPFQLDGSGLMGQASLTRTARDITKHGAVATVELNHAGHMTNVIEEGGFVYGVADGVRPDGTPTRAYSEERIEELINLYVRGAQQALRCGFNMITLHGGHAWLMAQFMSSKENTRKDKWGGSFENRMRFTHAVIDGIRKVAGRAVPIEIRISGTEWVPQGYDFDEGIAIAKDLDGKVDLIHVSVGHHDYEMGMMRTHPTMFLSDACNLQFAAEIKKHVKTPVATVGALTDVDQMEEIIASGQADVIQLGRQTLADPDLPIKAMTGREDEIARCMRCFTCFSNSSQTGVFYCAINPKIGHERENMYDTPPYTKKKVLVAGGGIGGMQAAITCAERGHEVVLCEKTDKLGGVLHCEINIPFKSKLENYIDLQVRKISRLPIDVRLNTPATPELAESIAPDVIIAAMGSRPVKPPIKGIDLDKVHGAEEVYYHPEIVGKKAVILGGGLVGLELGVFLAMEKHDVTIVEMMPRTLVSPDDPSVMPKPGEPIVQGFAIRDLIKNWDNYKVLTSTKALEINEEGLVVEGPDGVKTIPADTVIYAVGQRSVRDEAIALSTCAREFHMIGDSVAPRNIFSATQAAYQIARDIGRY